MPFSQILEKKLYIQYENNLSVHFSNVKESGICQHKRYGILEMPYVGG